MDKLHFSVRYENYESVFIRRVKTDDDSITHKIKRRKLRPAPHGNRTEEKHVYIISYDAGLR